jgi:sugar phosphate permease
MTLAFNSHTAVLYICTFMFGLTMGPLLMMQSLLIGECFGIPSFATVAGTIGLVTMPGAAFGPVIAGMIFDATQSYAVSFIFFSSLSFISAGIVWFARPPRLEA